MSMLSKISNLLNDDDDEKLFNILKNKKKNKKLKPKPKKQFSFLKSKR